MPVVILNATKLTDMRTGAAGAVAGKYLSSKKEIVLGLIGTGRQAEAQYRAISRELDIREIKCWSRNARHAEKFAETITDHDARSVPVEKACDCDLLVTTTPSRAPVVRSEWVHDGTHINAIGADAPGKQELDPLLLRRGLVFVDDMAQAVHSGEINVPVAQGIFTPENIAGTLGEVVLGMKGRKNTDQLTIFDSTGLAIQDLAIAAIAMRNGRAIDLTFP
jgi:alanine dehydrogenase